MTSTARVTLVLLGLGTAAGAALGLGLGRPPDRPNRGVEEVLAEARRGGRDLFTERRCVNCHGEDGRGTEMGPGLGALMPEYLAAAGGDEAEAKRRLAAYLKDPAGTPRLRRDGTLYPNPMPSARGLGLGDEEIAKVVDFVLRIRPPARAVGGDAQK